MKTGRKEIFINTLQRPIRSEWKEVEQKFEILSNNQSTYGRYKNYPYTWPLYEALAEYEQCDTENILPTRGAEEALKIIYNTYGQTRTHTIRANPTFGLISFFEELNELKPLLADYVSVNHFPSLTFNHLLTKNADSTSIVYIAMPDNPTGSIIDHFILNDVISLCEEKNIKVVLDLVYYDYFNSTNICIYSDILNSVYRRKNLILVNSFSKSHGLAGIRSGYIVSNRNIISTLSKLRPVQEVNSVAVKETIKVIKNKKIVNKNIKHCNYWKNKFHEKFSNYIQSHGNFILLRYYKDKEQDVYNKLYKNKILTRVQFDHDVMKGIIRIGIGKSATMKKIMRILNDKHK